MSTIKKLYRSKTDRIIFGICGGLGEYFEIDPLIVRILFILLSLTGGSGIVVYIILAFIMPEEGGVKAKVEKPKADKTKDADEVVDETKEKAQPLVKEIKVNKNWIFNVRNIIGSVIILIGLNILFEQVFSFSPFAWINWGVIWALVIVIIGSKIILGNNKN